MWHTLAHKHTCRCHMHRHAHISMHICSLHRSQPPTAQKVSSCTQTKRDTHTHTFTHTWGMRSHHISLMRHRQQQQEMMIKAYFHRFSILFDEFLHTFLEAALTHVRSLRPRAFPREQQREREGARDESEREAVRA